jgi:hypothetical protein
VRTRPTRPLAAVPRYTVTRKEAAASLGMSINHFERRVQPDLKIVLCGQLVLIPLSELERWVERNARHLIGMPAADLRLRGADSR